MCREAPVLTYADHSKPFLLQNVASLEAVLGPYSIKSRRVKNEWLVTPAEVWHPLRRSILPINLSSWRWNGLLQTRFHDYRYRNQFTVHWKQSFQYIPNAAKLDAMGYRWIASFFFYKLDIVHRSRANNTDADALSRITWSQELKEVVSESVVEALRHQDSTDYFTVESFGFDEEIVPDDHTDSQLMGLLTGLRSRQQI